MIFLWAPCTSKIYAYSYIHLTKQKQSVSLYSYIATVRHHLFAFVAIVTQSGGGTLFSQNAAILWWVAPITCLIGAVLVVFLNERYHRQELNTKNTSAQAKGPAFVQETLDSTADNNASKVEKQV